MAMKNQGLFIVQQILDLRAKRTLMILGKGGEECNISFLCNLITPRPTASKPCYTACYSAPPTCQPILYQKSTYILLGI